MLKVWVDHHGLGDTWRRAQHPRAFDATQWLGDRGTAWDDEQIGLLAHPPPTLAQLTAQLRHRGLEQPAGRHSTVDGSST